MSVSHRAGSLVRHANGRRRVTDAGSVRRSVQRGVNALCALEHILYRVVIVPLVAFLPAPVAYGVACLRGDIRYRIDAYTRDLIARNLEDVLGDQLSPSDRISVIRHFFRRRSCEAVDVMRLTGKGQALMRLVEIRGLEHVEAALARGKGAIICSAHFGQFNGAFSLLGAHGYPVTAVGNWAATDDPGISRLRRLVLWLIHERQLAHHRHRPEIQPGKAGPLAATRIAEVLRANEVVCIPIDAPILDPKDLARAVQVDFLGRQARLLPGSAIVARRTGAPVLVAAIRRSEDWRHQVLEISCPCPMSLDSDSAMAFKRYIAEVEDWIRQLPAHWDLWEFRQMLINLGLVPGKARKSPAYWDFHPNRLGLPSKPSCPIASHEGRD